MANAQFLDGNGDLKNIAFPTGDGEVATPFTGYGSDILAQLQAVVAALGGTLDVSGATLTINLPTGASTSANQATIIGHVDGIETLLTTLAGAVAGTEVQVDVVSLPNVTVGAALPAGTNNIGDVDVVTLPALPAGTNTIGVVGSPDTVVTITPTLDTSAYTAGDLLFDSTEVANAVRANGGTCVVQSITIVDKDDQKLAMTLVFADAATDFGTLNSAPDADDTEVGTVGGCIAVAAGDYVDFGGASVATLRGLGLLLKAGAATTSLYLAAITGGTPTHSASGLVIKIALLRS